jgi:hypothetical protein
VTGRPQLVGERPNSGGQTLSVVEEQHIGHGRSPEGENGFVALTLSRPPWPRRYSEGCLRDRLCE